MTTKIKSTYKMLAQRSMQVDSIGEWIDWALIMMEAGHDGEYLEILAGSSSNMNRFEFDDILNRALKEVSLEAITAEEAVYGHVYFLTADAIHSKQRLNDVLDRIRQIFYARDYDIKLQDFYLLAFAKEDLEEAEYQFYWQEADRSNIDIIILDKFREWKEKYEPVIRQF